MNNSAPVTDITPAKPRVPMGEAASLLAELCHRIDDGEEPTAAIQAMFNETKLDLAASIDRRKAFAASLRHYIAACDEALGELRQRKASLEAVDDALKKETLSIMVSNPDLPYRDSFGRKLSICQSPAKLVLDLDVREKKTVSNILDTATIDLMGIEPRFVGVVQFLVLNTDAVKAALHAGEQLKWARLEQSSHLRGL